MIRVLQFCIDDSKGGRPQAILENAKHINTDEFVFDYIAFGKKLSFEEDITKKGGKVHYITCNAEQNKEQFIKEIDAALDHNYDVIHIHSSVLKGMVIEERARRIGIPKIIMHSHNTDVGLQEDLEKQRELRRQHIEKRNTLTLETATDFWACSRRAAEWLFGDRIPKEKIVIVKDSIDSKRFKYNEQTRNDVRKKYRLENKFVIGHIGRFAFQKNHDFLIEVFHKVKETEENAVLLLEGMGALREEIVEKVNNYNLKDSVIFLERYEKIEELYQVMDMFVFPSRFEGFGRVLLEAQCAGLKCLTSDVIPEDVFVSELIYALPLGEAENWADWILNHREYERKNGSSYIVNNGYDIVENVRELERLYKA